MNIDDETSGAVPWTHPRERGHMAPPPLRVRGETRPPREVHFDRAGSGRAWVVVHEWFAILGDGPDRRRAAIGWYSRAYSFWLPALLAAAAADAWKDLPDLIVMVPPNPAPNQVQGTLGAVEPEP